ncbi:MAG TPA: PilT/PilU family type 4a pilus ATPase [Patescibacteria group bacterium]|nr:PilT/PilU family type 4a pilus ATPase [Patescibacteria group bacterium]
MTSPVILQYFSKMHEIKASDLYLTVGFPPTLRSDSGLRTLRTEPLTIDEINEILASILTNRQRRDFDTHMELNTSLDVGRFGRYRVNALRQRQCPALVIRRIISKIPTFAELRLPVLLEKLALEKRGLILVTGMTGSGKSTTLAAMIDYRNAREEGHIITIEDPIEYFHDHKKSVVSQREVGVDTESYAVALKNALRQRPDVILVGEVRDREVMEQALTAAETGHLCLATLHTNNTYQSIERIVNLFPEEYHSQIRLNLSMNLRGIISQRLIPCAKEGVGMTAAIEVMLNQGFVKELIHMGDIAKIKEVMEQNNQMGMCTFDQSLLILYKEGLITEETALSQADQAGDLKIKIQQLKLGSGNKRDALKQMDTSLLSFSD